MLHTPGHTPAHISLLLYDGEQSSEEPAILVSGGALLVGDVARPHLLGGEEAARHVAGSLCGGSIASRLSTTIGYEKRVNPVLASLGTKEEFVASCLDLTDLPAVPPYWRRMRGQNRAGPAPLGVVTPPPALQPAEFAAADGGGTVVLDTRSPEAFAGAHVPGAQNVGLGASFATWAGTVFEPDVRILLVLDDPSDLMEVV